MKKEVKAKGKKLVSMLLVFVLAFALVGCGKEKPADNAGKNNAGTKENAAESPDSGSADSNFNQTGMPIAKEPVTLKVLTTRWGNMGDSFAKNEFLTDLEAKSNVKIEWQVKSLNDWNEQKGIMLASGELPDIIFGFQTFNDSDIMNNLDLFLPLNELISKYMPNYSKALEEMPDLKKLTTFPDGNMYSMGKNLPLRPTACNQPIINKKWLDNLGLQVPTTLDELYNVLKAFKDKDANGNGDPNDEIPISGAKGLSMDLLNSFGITDINGYKVMVNSDNSLTYYPASEAYKEGIKWLNKLYSEGIIDKEAFTQDDSMLSAKRQDPDVARVGFEYAWTPDSNFGKWSSEYEVIAPIKGYDGKQYTGGDPNGVSSIMRNEVLITKYCQNPEVAARWVDEFYTGEASIQNFWGGIGTVIAKHDDGTYTLNDPPAGTSADAWYWDSSLRDFGPKYVSKEFEKKIILSSNSGDGLKVTLSKIAEGTITTPYPNVMFTNEENEERPTITTDIDKYVESTRAHWITEGGIDKGWDEYVKQLNTMGLEELMKIYQEAYDRYSKQ
ncbi:type 2 periplasmic-binding domain-containing protein [Anaerocolumna xylanovorans]|uniref:Carbohydrate ABC transporter substrate-binding protein, CUT1 family (TC 3.A.1.1.-) n=1 Tax=Anaerocolumna xylanovorans DSM 12503 TaxID=1121345 RepID=A0A1M7Y4S1_9FIRM|nr:extracellular solute-binding protein [Anaerocolumna xylanovorans]SHO47361.1 carbohydrate ABC transporter substrate-binding protein, CUT1 family (TC 3.A.1.1.-) [Anaerocolumna xylanovorans DSM 12503]